MGQFRKNAKPRSHCPLGIVFVRQRVTKVHQQPIANIFRQMPLKTVDDGGASFPIRLDNRAQLFRVELGRERGRTHQVTKHHGELPAFTCTQSGVQRPRSSIFILFAFCPFRLFAFTAPDEYLPLFIDGDALRVDEFVLQVLQIGVIEGEPSLQRPIRHPTLALQQLYYLRKKLIEGHPRFSFTHCSGCEPVKYGITCSPNSLRAFMVFSWGMDQYCIMARNVSNCAASCKYLICLMQVSGLPTTHMPLSIIKSRSSLLRSMPSYCLIIYS